MPAKRKRYNSDDSFGELFARIALVVAFLFGAPLVTWWKSIPDWGHWLLIILSTLTLLAGVGALIALAIHQKRRRALAWQRAMSVWNKGTPGRPTQAYQTARVLSDSELEKFAAQVYSKMGYVVRRTGRTGDHGVDVHLTNPSGQVELVQCKQWRKPVGEPQVRDLLGAMGHTKAVRGWLWAPAGFSEPARRWVKNKPIVLIDDAEINRLVESSYRE